MKLDPPTEFHGGTYLGQTQEDVVIPEDAISDHQDRWKELFQDDRRSVHDPDSVKQAEGHRTAVESEKLQESQKLDELPQDDLSFMLDPQQGGQIKDPKTKASGKSQSKKAKTPPNNPKVSKDNFSNQNFAMVTQRKSGSARMAI